MKFRIYNPTLEPNLWNEDKTLKPEIREALLKVAEDFYNSTDLAGDIHNILFLGSSANYNWNPKSDIDVHIIVDIAEEKINEEYARKFMDSLSFKWNIEHNIEIKGHPVEVYLQDVREPNSDAQRARKGSAIYSIFDDKWILEPERHNIPLDVHKIKTKFQIIKKKIDSVIDSGDTDKLKELMVSIRNYRDAGLSKGGEFSVENLVFKSLRYGGYLKKLKDSIGSIYDKKRSLPEEGNILPHKKTEPLDENINKNKYIVVGIINHDLQILAQKDFIGGENLTHGKLLATHQQYKTGEKLDVIFWRYKTSNNTLYWIDTPTDDQRQTVLDWLHDRCGITGVRQNNGYGHNPESSKLDEANSIKYDNANPDLYVGIIDADNFKVVTAPVLTTNVRMDHAALARQKGIPTTGNLKFRFRKDKKTVYWQLGDVPTQTDKDVVDEWAKSNFGVTGLRHIVGTKTNDDLIHLHGNDLFFPD